MADNLEPITVKFPLRGEWTAVNTPAHRIPSHGTDYLGQRYAFDFVAQDHRGKLYSASFWRHLIGKVQVQDCYAWSQPVFSPIDGVVVDQKDGGRRSVPILSQTR